MRTNRKYNEPYNAGTITPYAGGSRDYFAAPIISNIQETDIQANQVTITWDTDIPSDTRIAYGLDSNYLFTDIKNEAVLNHSITITGLTTATLYHYQVQSKGNNTQIGKSADGTVTTL